MYNMQAVLFCRYYAVEFNTELHAVSIRQKQKLLRQTRQWGEACLAVEGQSQHKHEMHVVARQTLYKIMFRTIVKVLACLKLSRHI